MKSVVCYINCWRIILTKIDLHIHSSLSACGEDIMSPQVILQQAEKNKIDLIAITDHNTLVHSILINRLSKISKINILLGVELTSREEVHLLGYFPDEQSAKKMEDKIKECLPIIENNPSFFGYQLVYNDQGEICQIDHLLRQNALQMGLDDLVEFIHLVGGIAIPAHIDRQHCSINSQLGFLDPQSNYDAVEISKFCWRKKKYKIGDLLEGFPVISGSDSHFLDDIGKFFIEIKDDNINNFPSLERFLRKLKVEKHC